MIQMIQTSDFVNLGNGNPLNDALQRINQNFSEIDNFIETSDEFKFQRSGKEQCVATGGSMPRSLNTNTAESRNVLEGQKVFILTGKGGRVVGLKPVFANRYMATNAIPRAPQASRIACAIIHPNGTDISIYTINNELFPKIGKGAIVAADNGFDINIAPNTSFLVRTAYQVANSTTGIYSGASNASSLEAGRYHAASLIPADDSADCSGRVHNAITFTGYAPSGNIDTLNIPAPMMIVGIPEKPCPAIIGVGDSNAVGAGDTLFGDGFGLRGYLQRASRLCAGGAVGYVNAAVSGFQLEAFANGGMRNLLDDAHLFSHALHQTGGNSVPTLTLAAMKQRVIEGWISSKVRKLKNIQLELLPRTTAGNTVPVTGWEVGGKRDQFNAWAKSIVGRKINLNGDIDEVNGTIWLDAFWEINDLLQNPATNLWLSSSLYADEIHLSEAGHALIAARIAILMDNLTI